MIMMSIREAHAANRRLTIRKLIERFDIGYGTMHRILKEDLQMSKVILRYKFDFYMMHVAKVSDHSYNIVTRNNQFKGMRFRSLQELQAATSRIFRTVWTTVVRGRVRTVGPSLWRLCRVRRTLFREEVNRLSSALKFIH